VTKRYHYNQCPNCEKNLDDVCCITKINGNKAEFFKYNTSDDCPDFQKKGEDKCDTDADKAYCMDIQKINNQPDSPMSAEEDTA